MPHEVRINSCCSPRVVEIFTSNTLDLGRIFRDGVGDAAAPSCKRCSIFMKLESGEIVRFIDIFETAHSAGMQQEGGGREE